MVVIIYNDKSSSLESKKTYTTVDSMVQSLSMSKKRKLELTKSPDNNALKFIKCFSCAFETNNILLLKRHTIDHFDDLIECPECSFKTNRRSVLDLHITKHVNTCELHECSECSFESFSYSKLLIHKCTEKRRLNKNFKCFICKLVIPSRSELRLHLKGHNKNILKLVKCCIKSSTENQSPAKTLLTGDINPSKTLGTGDISPSKSIEFDENLVKNIKQSPPHVTDNFYICPYCMYESGEKHELEIHMQSHFKAEKLDSPSYESDFMELENELILYNCSKCEFETFDEKVYKDHFAEHSDLIVCSICDFHTNLNKKLENHYKKAHSEDMYKCQACDFETGNEDHFQDHVLDVHCDARLLHCLECGFETYEESEIQCHILSHPEVSKCKECQFESNGELCDLHLETYSYKEIYNCAFCLYTTNKKIHIQKHLVSLHSTTKVLKCSKCEFQTRDRLELKSHVSKEHEKLMKCPECFVEINSKSFKQHMRTHSDKKVYQCSTCSYETNRKDHLAKHNCTTHSKLYRCESCHLECKNKNEYKTHLQTHTGGKIYSCPICKFQSVTRSDLTRHTKQVHAKLKLLKCLKCKFETRNREELKSHDLAQHAKKELECPICNFKTTSKYFKQHLRNHSFIKLFYCPLCSYETNNKSHIKRHTLQVHCKSNASEERYKVNDPKAKVTCPICTVETTGGAYKKHIMKHCDIRFECNNCPFVAKTCSDLKRHTLRTHPNVERFKCPICRFEGYSEAELEAHDLASHKVLKCQQCDFETYRKMKLRKHLLTHAERLKCPDCDFKTNQKELLTSHKKAVHPRPKVFKCSECNYTARRRYHVLRHLLIHTNLKLVSCPKCDFKTKSKEYLKNHLVIHMEHKSLKCNYCDYRTNRKRHLKKHELIHSKTVTIPVVKVSDSSVEILKQKKKLKSPSINPSESIDNDFFEYML